MLLLLFYFTLAKSNCLITYFVCIKFVWYNFKFLLRIIFYLAIFHEFLYNM